MSTTELKIPFPTEKLDALRFFIEKKEQTIEQELEAHLGKTYERIVPAHVREYVESRVDVEQSQDQAPEAAAPEAARQPRPSRRQREQAAAEAPQAPEVQSEQTGSEPEENQRMSMSM
ncbi:hypothetical protein SDC9_88690 [bioreactor metagenome]|uniref:Uncharacterized protein n=1 Tax=bioreactor metagenome TaxID=1076179 RepID=A0A644ZNT6_9ZZZZ